MAYYPTADRNIKGNSGGSYTGGPFRGVLHTTEGSNPSGSISAFRKNNSWPHFLVDLTGKVWQFVDTNEAARALSNAPGGSQTNRQSAIQIEISGFAGKPNEHPPVQWDSLRALMRWIEQTHGVKSVGPGRPFATAYGQKHLRFSNAEWDPFNGFCGHCHIGEGNDHWDPGAIDLESLLAPPSPPPPPDNTQEIDVNIQIFNYSINTDSNGNGWISVPHQIDKIVGFLPPGLRPGVDGRYQTAEVSFAQEDPNTIISITKWEPGTSTIIRLRVSV